MNETDFFRVEDKLKQQSSNLMIIHDLLLKHVDNQEKEFGNITKQTVGGLIELLDKSQKLIQIYCNELTEIRKDIFTI
jgi:hypothetical protein